jgi:hypothetical protein
MKRIGSIESTYQDHDKEVKELIRLLNEVESRLAPGEELTPQKLAMIKRVKKTKFQ